MAEERRMYSRRSYGVFTFLDFNPKEIIMLVTYCNYCGRQWEKDEKVQAGDRCPSDDCPSHETDSFDKQIAVDKALQKYINMTAEQYTQFFDNLPKNSEDCSSHEIDVITEQIAANKIKIAETEAKIAALKPVLPIPTNMLINCLGAGVCLGILIAIFNVIFYGG
jgi:hypothetical protein